MRRASVTVWHPDALSTALQVMGPEEGLEWASERGISARGIRFTIRSTEAQASCGFSSRRWGKATSCACRCRRRLRMDNIFIERLWRALKYECVYLHDFEDGPQARQTIGTWIRYYNEERPHSTHADDRTPMEEYARRRAA